ncbi:MAG: ABC transporter substrate-binding protein [Anaerolineales bacterium]
MTNGEKEMPQVNSWAVLKRFLVIFLIAYSSSGCVTPVPPPEPVTLLLDWVDTPQFAGLYLAQVQGYYVREGLDVAIVPMTDPAAGATIPEHVVAGEAGFAVGGIALLNAQVAGAPLTAVAGVIQRNPQVIFARADSGIQSPRDFAGRRIGIKNESWREIISLTMETAGVSLDDTIEVPVGRDMQPFFDGEVDVWTGYALDEPVTAQLAGVDIVRIYPYEYGLGGYGMLLYTAQASVSQHPELVARFVRASLDGWNEVVRDPEGTVALLLAHYPKIGTPDYVAASIEALIPLIYTGENPVGWITPEGWAATYQKESLDPDEMPAGGLDLSFTEAYYAETP